MNSALNALINSLDASVGSELVVRCEPPKHGSRDALGDTSTEPWQAQLIVLHTDGPRFREDELTEWTSIPKENLDEFTPLDHEKGVDIKLSEIDDEKLDVLLSGVTIPFTFENGSRIPVWH